MTATCPDLKQAAWREAECGLTGVAVDGACPELVGESGRAECLPRLALRYLGGDETALIGLSPLAWDGVIQAARMIQQRRGIAAPEIDALPPSDGRRGPRHRWTAADMRTIAALRAEGLSFREIGDRLGLPSRRLSSVYHKHRRLENARA
jgi:hypothetical protein